MQLDGAVALVTGGANGIGTAVTRRLASLGTRVVVADVDAERGEEVAAEVDGTFVRCDVREPSDNAAAVRAALEAYGGLDVVHLNAGVSTGCGVGEDFDLERYRRGNAVNLDGVVLGVHAALPALRERGGGAIVATASLAGLTAMPMDPLYCANKHAVVGLVRSLGPALAGDGITVNALCPSFAETAILEGIREWLSDAGVPILDAEEVADAFVAAVGSGRTGECWWVQPGRPSEPFRFRGVPGPRMADGEPAPTALADRQVSDEVAPGSGV